MDILEPDFLIIGAGLTGSSLAMGLRKLNFDVCVVEQEASAYEHFRGEYLQPLTLEILREVGLGGAIDLPENVAIKGLRFRDLCAGNSSVRSEVTVAYPDGMHALAMPNNRLIRRIREILRTTIGPKFHEGATLSPENLDEESFQTRPVFTLKTAAGESYRVRPRVVVGCDGKQSKTRGWIKGPRAIKNGHTVLGAQPEFIVGCEAKNLATQASQYEVIRTDGAGTVSIFSLGDGNSRIYWNAPAAMPTPAKGVGVRDIWTSNIQAIFRETGDLTGLKLENPMRVCGAPAYTAWYGPSSKGRFFLAGDSLAVTTPFGGQGMTCGAIHVRALLALFGESPSFNYESIRKSYETTTHDTFAHFNLVNTGLYYLFFSRAHLFKSAAHHVLDAWHDHPESVARIGRMFAGADLETPALRELLQLWGIYLPNMVPLKLSASLIKPHKILDRLTRWTDATNTRAADPRIAFGFRALNRGLSALALRNG